MLFGNHCDELWLRGQEPSLMNTFRHFVTIPSHKSYMEFSFQTASRFRSDWKWHRSSFINSWIDRHHLLDGWVSLKQLLSRIQSTSHGDPPEQLCFCSRLDKNINGGRLYSHTSTYICDFSHDSFKVTPKCVFWIRIVFFRGGSFFWKRSLLIV